MLILGMIGFHPELENRIEQALAARPDAAVRWRTGAPSKADAWCINGARAQLLADGSLRIGSPEPGARSVRLALADVSRPIAFCEPLANPELEPAYSFGIGDTGRLCAILDAMESRWLAATALRRWIAGRLIAADGALVHRIYHLVSRDRLLAVIDRVGTVGWLPGTTLEELEHASWVPRPSTAGFIPHAFHRATLSELVWDYAVRAQRQLLPERYRTKRIHFRRPPNLAPGLVGDEHLLVMRELVVRPSTFAELEQRTGLGSVQLAQALAALYYTGSITTSTGRARHVGHPARPARVSSGPSSLWSPSSRPGTGAGAPIDFTVPASFAPAP